MKKSYGAQTVETLPGKRVVKSGAVGATNADEVRWLIKQLAELSAPWRAKGWVYMVDISKMAPASPEVSTVLVDLHKQLMSSGCKGMAFVEGAALFVAAQAKQHQKDAHTVMKEQHFKTEADALKWIDTILK